MGLCCVELYYTPPSAWLTLGVLLATGLVFALLTLYFQVNTSLLTTFINFIYLLLLFYIIALLHFQKSLTILGSSFYGGAILLATTDYFIQDSLVLDWVWERVKVSSDWLILRVLSCDWSRWMWRTRMWTSWPRYPSAGWPG